MKKLKCTISYDGTHFSGYQVQPNKRTVQLEIEHVLKRIHKGKNIRVYASGRTDSGVHAKGQVIHFETDLQIPVDKWKDALNAIIPKDIYVKKVEEVSLDFHAQYDAIEKEYRYFILNSKEPDVFKRNYMYYYPFPIDIDAMQEACNYLEGTHDFTSFCSARSNVKGSKERTLYEVSCQKEGNELQFILRGNGFLYNMVRIIVGVLLDVGSGKITAADIEAMLKQKDRTAAGITVPPTGLFLWEVSYR
ncbi:tRNA pseudouridine(38-40) synthase TruA [Pseudogracilibacillus sp. SE30717A]|uniref:tRNA pseudouridine(38-40) synthase TruA n=1 Tax=Pseudogracilibacillus sp. SE30717A TaxID=3098293 RepID=UPI00300E2BDB